MWGRKVHLIVPMFCFYLKHCFINLFYHSSADVDLAYNQTQPCSNFMSLFDFIYFFSFFFYSFGMLELIWNLQFSNNFWSTFFFLIVCSHIGLGASTSRGALKGMMFTRPTYHFCGLRFDMRWAFYSSWKHSWVALHDPQREVLCRTLDFWLLNMWPIHCVMEDH